MELPREDPIRPRDLLIVVGVIACLFGAYRAAKWILTPSPTFVRIQPMAGTESGCRVEVWVAGKPGDHLFRLKEYGRHGQVWSRGAAILNQDRASVDLPVTVKTAQGECSVGRYHLMVNGQEADSIDLMR